MWLSLERRLIVMPFVGWTFLFSEIARQVGNGMYRFITRADVPCLGNPDHDVRW